MDAVFLSRIQFALNAGFHFLFPPLTLGICLFIVIFEGLYLKTDREQYKTLSSFLIKILTLIFTVGVATGIVLEFAFGMNWSKYSRMVGDIFGAPLAAEGIFAFFLESVFLGVLIFGRNRVSKKTYFISAFLVFFASHLSALWILIANSWMQTPAGFALEGGRAVLTDFFEAAVNHSTLERFLHTIVASWISGSLFLAGVSAWYILKKRDLEYARPILAFSLSIFIAVAILQFGTGHLHSVQVARTQPVKMASFEALWKSMDGAPMSIIGFPDEAQKKTNFEISVPRLLSLLIHFDPNGRVQGLDEFPDDEKPPVLITYLTYHLMIGLGSFFALLAIVGAILLATKRIYESSWFLWILVLSIPLPLIANELGWMSAEIGRQPWVVYKILKTSQAASVTVTSGEVLFSLILFSLIYILLFIMFIRLLLKIIKKGPAGNAAGLESGY
jgi:cytochrome bd ubiquinol oxidase subunit I